jgi:hypothetical protein
MSFDKTYKVQSNKLARFCHFVSFPKNGKVPNILLEALQVLIYIELAEDPKGSKLKLIRPYLGAVADIEIEIMEVTPHPHGITKMKLVQEEIVNSRGHQKFQKAFRILKQVADYAVDIFAALPKEPLVGALIGSVWKLVCSLDRRKEAHEGRGRVTSRHYRPWTFQAWHQRPFSIAQAYNISFSLTLGRHSPILKGPMEYKVNVRGLTGKTRFARIDFVEEMNSELKYKVAWS